MKRKIIYVGLIAICFGIGVALWPDNSSKQVLADGTVIVLSGLKVGRTNVYTHGSWLSKSLGRLAPSKGVTVFGVELRPPEKTTFTAPHGLEVLSAQFALLSGSPREKELVTQQFSRKFRMLISGDDGLTFVREFYGFRRQAGGLFCHVYANSFPRDSRRLQFRLEEREKSTGRDWRPVASFVVRNPKPARIESWTPELSPHFQVADGLEMEVGELVVRHEPIHPDDIWEDTALLPVRITRNGLMATNWVIAGGDVYDASGNFDRFTFSKVTTNDWMIYRMFRPLDPSKVWRFHVSVALGSDFPATNLFSFSIPWPLATPIQTNLGGFPVRIGYVNTDMLNVELTNKPPETRLTFLNAVDDAGNGLDTFSGSWGQHSFWKSLRLSKPTQVHATLAIHPNYEVVFTLAPRDETAASRPDALRPDAE